MGTHLAGKEPPSVAAAQSQHSSPEGGQIPDPLQAAAAAGQACLLVRRLVSWGWAARFSVCHSDLHF